MKSAVSGFAPGDNYQLGTGYRAQLRLPDGVDAVALAERHVRQWLREKLNGKASVDDWDGETSHRFDQQFSITVASRDDEQSAIKRRLFRLIDDNVAGRFRISVFAIASSNDRRGIVVVEGAREGSRDADAIDAVGTPRIVREILDEVDAFDGSTRLTGSPVTVRPADVDAVLDAIVDSERQASVIVASSPSREVDERWSQIAVALTRNSVGVAATFVIADDAVDMLNERLPRAHQVPRGNVRTFAPAVDVTDPADGLAHRFLGPATLARSVRGRRVVGRLTEVHARGPRSRLLERGLPSDVRRSIDLLEREERRENLADEVARRVSSVAVDAAAAGPNKAIEQPQLQPRESGDGIGTRVLDRLRLVVQRWLGRPATRVEDVVLLDTFITNAVEKAEVAEEYTEHVEDANMQLETTIAELRERLDERDFDIALSADELRDAEGKNRFLTRRLRELQEFEVADDADEDDFWAAPADVEELTARITPGGETHSAFTRVVFTGDDRMVAEVRKRDPYGKYAQDLWGYVRVLYEYAEMRATGEYDGNVHMYLTDESHDSFKCSPQRHAARESETVLQNDRWRSERMLPVPAHVDDTEQVLMDAHFKPTHRDQFAPRMHYFDDTAGSGKIYIGYIGRHLTNTKS